MEWWLLLVNNSLSTSRHTSWFLISARESITRHLFLELFPGELWCPTQETLFFLLSQCKIRSMKIILWSRRQCHSGLYMWKIVLFWASFYHTIFSYVIAQLVFWSDLCLWEFLKIYTCIIVYITFVSRGILLWQNWKFFYHHHFICAIRETAFVHILNI